LSEGGVSELSASLVKMTIEAALGAEMEHHLGYASQPLKTTQNIDL
jgi:transposase-like protein